MNNRISPCMTCTRVIDPANCENKNCQVWQRWFLARWEAMRRSVRVSMEQAPRVKVGASIGGRRYATPHVVYKYLNTDPCGDCVCAGELCHEPCPSRRSWEVARRDMCL